VQFNFRDTELRSATIQTDKNLREYPHDGLINLFQSGNMDGYFPAELARVD
jgi:hypothetical protein